MATTALDTLKLFDQLGKAGFSAEQARAVSQVVLETHEAADVATKQDMEALEARVDNKFERVDNKFELLRRDIADVRKDIQLSQARTTITLGSIVIASAAALATFQHLHWLL